MSKKSDYCYHSVNVVSLFLSQSDHIKRLSLYFKMYITYIMHKIVLLDLPVKIKLITLNLMINKISCERKKEHLKVKLVKPCRFPDFTTCMTEVLLMQVPSGKMRMGSLVGSSTCSFNLREIK